MTDRTTTRRPLGYETRIVLLATSAVLPSAAALTILLLFSPLDRTTKIVVAAVVLLFTLLILHVLHDRLTYPLRTLANLLAALREEDYSIRARGSEPGDALGEVMTEVNELSDLLQERRLGALEATALLQTVISEIDAAIFAFDSRQKLRLVNRAGEHLLGTPAERLIGCSAADLHLTSCLEHDSAQAMEISFPGASGRWGVRRSSFREHGRQHTMLMLTDLSQALRDEERQAWRRLVRVLSHELNNSLAPIKSIAASLLATSTRRPVPAGWTEDVEKGLSVISSRSESLTRFMEAYARLARLPRPQFRATDASALIQRAAQLERRLSVTIEPGKPVEIEADADQIEQLIINIVRNAADAALETGGGVRAKWTVRGGMLEIAVIDDGPGLAGSANLFVPFYTTKPGGTGIGLVLSRQIADAHGGTLTLDNRTDACGCIATLRLPLRQPAAESGKAN